MIKHDYKDQNYKQFSKKLRSLKIPHWVTHPYVIIFSAFVVVISAILVTYEEDIETEVVTSLVDEALEQEKLYSDPIDIQLEVKAQTLPKSDIPVFDDQSRWKIETIRKGDNLSTIFNRIGLSATMVHQVFNLDENTKRLGTMKPGEAIWYQLNGNELAALKYTISLQETLYVTNNNGELSSHIENKTVEYRTAYASGTIKESLFLAGKEAGLKDSQIMALANIFGWDIDFILDIREGDAFSMIYEEKFIDGEKIGYGDILVAEFVNQGKSYRAVRYTNSKGKSDYYTPDGLSMRKAFLRAPLNFSYISSNFNPKRFHPILKKTRAHNGIDYRAPTGTPVRAAGDGKVIASSYNQYNGKYIFIQHGQGIVTKYLHLSRRAVSKNKRVRQGQVIGYVGSTGMSEAPHLHYEFVVNGVHRNPRTVKLPQAKPIDKQEKVLFEAQTDKLFVQLDSRNSLQGNSQSFAQ